MILRENSVLKQELKGSPFISCILIGVSEKTGAAQTSLINPPTNP